MENKKENEEVRFFISTDLKDVKVSMNGGIPDLIKLLVNVMQKNEAIAIVVKKAYEVNEKVDKLKISKKDKIKMTRVK